MKLRRAVFLDRDGVLNASVLRNGKPHPPSDRSELKITPGAAELLSDLKARGFLLIVVTNQPDVARGTQTREQVEEIHRVLREALPLDDVFTCFHDDADRCACRKPAPGMFLDAALKHGVDLSRSFLIGDRWRDMDAGASAGCATVFIDFGYGERAPDHAPTARVDSLNAGVAWVLEQSEKETLYPPPPGESAPVLWTEEGFHLPDAVLPVLKYGAGASGWSEELTALHEAEAGSEHYIDIASRKHALSRVQRYCSPSSRILDAGCSSGHLLSLLRREMPEAQLIGADYIPGPLDRLARQMPGIPLVQFDLTDCPLPDEFVDAVIALNVLEHIADDGAAVRQIFRLLKPGGVAIIEAPAGPGLFDIYDRQLMHHRRYRMRDLAAMFRSAGFEIVEQSHLGAFLYPAFWAVKKRNQRYLDAPPDERERRVVASIRAARHNPLMTAVMQIEARLRDWLPYPVGIRCLLVARRGQR